MKILLLCIDVHLYFEVLQETLDINAVSFFIELPSENVHASVSLTADEAASLLHLAAALIQAYIRGFLQRRRYQKTLRRHKAAVKLQAVW